MATSRPSTPSNLVQVHTYRHLAPAYAAAPSQGSGSLLAASSSSSLNNIAAVRPFTPLEVRQLVLEYLAHEGYVDSAIAFATEMVTDDDADASAASGEEEEEEESHASSVINGNGENVAFLEDGDDIAGPNGVVKPSALSEEQVQDLRLRKSESSARNLFYPFAV